MKSKQTHGVTEWFPVSVNPVRDGVYEVDTPNCLANRFAYYDSDGWRLCTREISESYDLKLGEPIHGSSMYLPNSRWRGLSSKP
jgi:hypothetical protein